MTYEYEVIKTGQIIEVQQRITEDAHTVLEIDGELMSVRRLISKESGGFRLVSGESGGWASSGYARPDNFLKFEKEMGRRPKRAL